MITHSIAQFITPPLSLYDFSLYASMEYCNKFDSATYVFAHNQFAYIEEHTSMEYSAAIWSAVMN